MKKRMKKVQALLLAGAMLFSVQTGVAMAADPVVGQGTESVPAHVAIQKDLIFADGITVPNATFQFEVKKITPDAPEAMINAITFSNADTKGEKQGNIFKVSKHSDITFTTAFPHAGVYEYDVVETPDTYQQAANESVTYATEQYRLRVYVENGADKLFVEAITAEKSNGAELTGTKESKILFENTYTKKANLIVKKMTAGEFADKTKQFEFDITLTKSPTASADQNTVSAQISSKNGPQTVEITYGQAYRFQLSDNQTLEFKDLPVGTTYIVQEIGAKDDYTPSVQVIENGVNKKTESDKHVKEEEGLQTDQTLVGEKENTVTFTNTYKDTPVTGIIMNNLPFVVMIGVAILAFVAFLFGKSRKTDN